MDYFHIGLVDCLLHLLWKLFAFVFSIHLKIVFNDLYFTKVENIKEPRYLHPCSGHAKFCNWFEYFHTGSVDCWLHLLWKLFVFSVYCLGLHMVFCRLYLLDFSIYYEFTSLICICVYGLLDYQVYPHRCAGHGKFCNLPDYFHNGIQNPLKYVDFDCVVCSFWF